MTRQTAAPRTAAQPEPVYRVEFYRGKAMDTALFCGQCYAIHCAEEGTRPTDDDQVDAVDLLDAYEEAKGEICSHLGRPDREHAINV